MDLDSRAYSKLSSLSHDNTNFEKYQRILEALRLLGSQYDHETPEIICDSLVFTPANSLFEDRYRDNHLKRCISGNTISNEHARRNEILKSIDTKEFQIWQYKQYILQEEAKINRLSYLSAKATIAENTIPSTPKFEPACISVTSAGNQEMIPPTSYQSSNCKSDTGEIFI
ncbi:hypothetical protein GLOIN_2v1873913 [Rhizophagus irregularis DAOM 181602=DAOM 197198]|uniref:Uncharacterized protein n=1 Tax=Rhizophagus irregularis (strain DAOM 181602 / DAOM 197198 / MUCL 43194) TaxID=747089 RepID=A0A2P4Q8M7_RHIID|nr:hypothetical protein GLOIN_2v1884844 [Rhizophagus irregularis DAOM 181602=DAOM 197198]XP_025180855.1 hypothetical protein GLOIN_2v1873913 [Rhizophagus irregularis DAOM 181602=DAOM 197198]POG59726.1 hypothetical protein GLOIN_2v1884844 [Rhizophagus irregularis DAOM 181602=DAOM 197198]POG73989.1 hypothetical protein GLOIN_2v1873913 [Rhizophagus irregularis DAOM 181602=DAOM 197198]|eukprot:XP_025166592.1 hypothetical protein GLOIN_2v1884844 [Rhizophagus irregularis DAOM 181602=DAOM 197198]